MKWGLWSVTAGSNSATPPDGWPEGQAPSTVNDCAREMMAQIRTGLNNLQFVDLGVTPTETGNTTFTLAGNQMQWYPYGNRVQANVGGTLYTGTVISSSYTTNTGVTLRFDGGIAPLTNSLSAVATGYPSAVNGALPEAVFRRKNYFDNSHFDIWQRGVGPFSLSSNGATFAPDRWKILMSVASAGATVAVSRAERSAAASNVPTLAQAGVFLNNCLIISCNAAVAGISATDSLIFEQQIEGFDYRGLAGKPITLSFWVNSGVTGTYCVSITNAGADHSMVMQYSISSVATWEKKTINFIKPPTAGTWDYSTGAGLSVRFCLAAGSGVQGGAGNWTAANIVATSAQTNFLGTANKTFMFTAAQIEEGNQASPLEPTNYQRDLDKCKRYLQIMNSNNGDFLLGYAVNTTTALYQKIFSPELRTSPTFAIASPTAWYMTTAAGNLESCSAVSINSNSRANALLLCGVVGTPLTTGQGSQFLGSAGGNSVIYFSAEI